MINPSEAVARIQDIAHRRVRVGPIGTPGYVPGQFYLATNMMGPAGSTKVHALVFRGKFVAVAHENMLLKIGDRVRTGPDILMALEFLIGGRVGINESTEVVIDSERSVADHNTPTYRVLLKNFALWTKADAKALKQPLEIQTNGGTMGIKG
jgi:hypothetical protein